MIAASYNLGFNRGDTVRRQFRLWVDNDKDRPADLAGATAMAILRDGLTDRQILALECVVQAPNIIEMALTSVQSRDLPTGGLWELKLTYPSGDVVTVLKGPVHVDAVSQKLAVVK
jgi:hypothetical protein